MILFTSRWILPLVLALAGMGLALLSPGVPPLTSATFITSAQPAAIDEGLASALSEATVSRLASDLGMPAAEFRRRLRIDKVKADEVRVTFDGTEVAVARRVVVEVVKAIGATGKVPVVALELGKTKPEPSPVRITLGGVLGAAAGVALRQLLLARLLPAK